MKTLALLLCAMAALAANVSGTWKLDRQKSTIVEALPSFFRGDTLGLRPSPTVNTDAVASHFLMADGNVQDHLYSADVSADGKTLTIRRVKSFEDQSGKQFNMVMVLEKQ